MKKKILISVFTILILTTTVFSYATTNQSTVIPEEWRRDVVEEDERSLISKTYTLYNENNTLLDAQIDGNLFGAGESIVVDNVIVEGDVFIFAQEIDLKNITVYGTVFLAGEKVNLENAKILGNIFGAGSNIVFSGETQDIFLAGNNIKINSEERTSRELFAFGKKIKIDGMKIYRNANISAEQLEIGSNVLIEETLNYSSQNEATISNDAIIKTINFEKIEETDEKETSNFPIYNVVILTVKTIFICGFIFLFAKGFMEKQKTEDVIAYIGLNILKGLIWLILIPIIAIILLLTGVSVGLSIVIILLYSIILWLGVPIVSLAIAVNIRKKSEYNAWKTYGCAILIAIILSVIKQLPTIGVIFTLIISLSGMGIIFTSIKNKKEIKQEAVIKE